MSPEPLNIVFLGCGAVTASHTTTLRGIDANIRLFYASRDRARAADYERRLGGAGSYGSYEAALADGLIDVAVVATPPPLHLPLALDALANDKDVIVEKPVALRPDDCAPLAAASTRTGRRVLVAENYAYKPLTQTLRKLLSSGAIGDLRLLQLNALKHQPPAGWRADAASCGGGALFEGGVHWLHLLASIGPPVRSVRGFGPGNRDPERRMVVVAEYDGGGIATLTHSWETRSLLRGLSLSRIYGSEGSIAFESNGLLTVCWGRRKQVVPGLTRDISGYRAMFTDFISALRDGTEPRMTLQQAQRDLQLVEQAYTTAYGPRNNAPDEPSTPIISE
jgi:predicted dehydrogenase